MPESSDPSTTTTAATGALTEALGPAFSPTQEREEPEKEVIAILIGRGYRVRSQYPVGAYRIDIVVEDGPRRLAVECDGERAHPPERLKEDMKRQAVLERRGWTFVRLRGTAFYRDREAAMATVFSRLQEMGVRPVLNAAPLEQTSPEGNIGRDLVAEIVRRAEELEREWDGRDAEDRQRALEQRAASPPIARRWRRRYA